MDDELISTSKFLSLVLRHRPEAIGIHLSKDGWAEIADLLEASQRKGRPIERDLLLRVVHENDKQRFAISSDGERIRANQGHSTTVDLGFEACTPPGVLYHGTVERCLAGIASQGLISGARLHVHLSSDPKTAESVGRRRGKPVVLRIHSLDMHQDRHSFFLSQNGVWLTDHVPPRYIEFQD